MSVSSLSSRAIIGRFYQRLEAVMNMTAVGQISMLFDSDQASEEYRWLGMSPAMREWIGGRQAKGLRDAGMTVRNRRYEATLKISVDDLRRDKTGQIMVRVDDLATRAAEHWDSLLTALIVANGTCYDGSAFFADAHSEGDSGSQDNNLAYNVTTPASPTAAEYEAAVLQAVQTIIGFKDDQGEPLNANAKKFLVQCPTNHMQGMFAALNLPVITDGSGARTALIANLNGYEITGQVNPRLAATDVFYTYRTDASVKPFIRQEEVPTQVKAIAEGSEREFTDAEHWYGVEAVRAVGYGFWQHAAKTTLT